MTVETETETDPKKFEALKARARQFEQDRDDLQAKLAAIESERTTSAAAARASEEELARKSGDFTKIEESYKTRLAAETAAAAEATAKVQRYERNERSARFAEAIGRQTGIKDINAIRGVLRLASDDGFDDAPEKHTPELIADAIARLQRDAPTYFATTRSTPAPNAGTNDTSTEVPAQFAGDPHKRAAYLAGVEMSRPRR